MQDPAEYTFLISMLDADTAQTCTCHICARDDNLVRRVDGSQDPMPPPRRYVRRRHRLERVRAG